MTIEEARENLDTWLERAAHNSTYSKWDKLVSKAFELLSEDEYKSIYDKWAKGYIACSDGYARKR